MSEPVLKQPDDLEGRPSPLRRFALLGEGETTGSGMVLTLGGELDMATAPMLTRDLNTALDARPPTLTLDISELTFVDSTGLGVLISAHRRAGRAGCAFILRSPGRAVLRTLKLTGLDEHLTIETLEGDG